MIHLQDFLGRVVGGLVESKLKEERRIERSIYEAIRTGHRDGVRIIAELKPSAPGQGRMIKVDEGEIRRIVSAFEEGGASAISVLVEPRLFNGGLKYLRFVREQTDLPLLAKGFLFEPHHLAEVMAAGADSFLLMVRVLNALSHDPKGFLSLGERLGLEAMIEANCPNEIGQALEMGANVLAVNNRDIYGNLTIDLNRVGLGMELPKDVAFVSASGVSNAGDIQRVYETSGSRIDAILVGTSLMRSTDISNKVREFVDAGREVME